MANIFEKIPTLNWEELNGKSLQIHTSKDTDELMVFGVEVTTGKAYLLACDRIKNKLTRTPEPYDGDPLRKR